MSFMAAREHGSKPGTGGHTSAAQENVDRRERLRRLALETIDISKDPYFLRNHLGQYECRLCLTVHKGEGSYLAHTQGRRHQGNLAKRAAREAERNREASAGVAPRRPAAVPLKKGGVKIGRPGYRVTKQYDPSKDQRSLLFQIEYPEIADAVDSPPRHRLMSCFEQRKERPPDRSWQYVVFAAEPYETIAFKVPNAELEQGGARRRKKGGGNDDGEEESAFFVHWDSDAKVYSLQLPFRPGVKATVAESAAAAAAMTTAAEQQRPPPPPMPPQMMTMMPPPPMPPQQQQMMMMPPPPQMQMQMMQPYPPYPPPPQHFAPPPQQQQFGYGGRGRGRGGGGFYRGGPPPPPPPPPYYDDRR